MSWHACSAPNDLHLHGTVRIGFINNPSHHRVTNTVTFCLWWLKLYSRYSPFLMITSTLPILCDTLTSQSTNSTGAVRKSRYFSPGRRNAPSGSLFSIAQPGHSMTDYSNPPLYLAIEVCKVVVEQRSVLQ